MAGFMILASLLATGSVAKRIATNQVHVEEQASASGPGIHPGSVHPALPLRTVVIPRASIPVASMPVSGNPGKYPAELRKSWDGLRTSTNVWMGLDVATKKAVEDTSDDEEGDDCQGDHCRGVDEQAAKETSVGEEGDKGKYGRDPRPFWPSVKPAADWVVPAKGTIGQIAGVPELDAALAAAKGRSKLVVLKFFAPWCSSCKAIEPKFRRTAKANADAADFYSVDFSMCKPYCKASNIKYMPAAHIYMDGVLQEAMPLGPKDYRKFAKRLGQISEERLGQISAASNGESGGESDGDAPMVTSAPVQVAAVEPDGRSTDEFAASVE